MRKIIPFFCLFPAVYALPTNPEIINGIIQQNGAELICSDRSVLQWQEFNIKIDESLRFTLPSSQSAVLNQVQSVAQIDGSLFSNGQVYFSAPNGVVIGKDAVIDVGALLISTLPIDQNAFIKGEDLVFSDGGLIREANISIGGTLLSKSPDGKLYINAPNGQVDISGKMEGRSIDVRAKTIGISPQAEIASTGSLTLVAEQEQNLAGSLRGQTVQIEITAPQASTTHLLGQIRGVDSVRIKMPNLVNQGAISASEVFIETSSSYVDVSQSSVIAPTKISFSGNGDSSFFASGTLNGEEVSIQAGTILMAGAKVHADGKNGGTIAIGNREFTKSIVINGSTKITAKGTEESGGTVRVISKVDLEQYGSINVDGKIRGGEIEVSGENVSLSRDNRLSALGEVAGRVFFDPKNITVAATPTGVYPQYDLLDPTPTLGTGFGSAVSVLSTGNVVVTKPNYNPGGAADTGAVYLYDGLTAELISTLTGSAINNLVGNGGITTLVGNGNYVVRSQLWDIPGGAANVGAVTWGSGTTGVAGTVSVANSLIGSTATDSVSSTALTALTNGNYVVGSQLWNIPGGAADVGAATWGSGTTGITGTVSALNSLIGSTANDVVSSSGIVILTNGNYAVRSSNWSVTGAAGVGAATWGSGTTGVTGTVGARNSLIGSTANDNVSSSGLTALTNGNYVVRSQAWSIGVIGNVGAATWGNGTTGITGTVSALNSLIGSTAADQVSNTGVTALTNGNYVVRSQIWNVPGEAALVGAATWGSGTTGVTGTVGARNSLIGSSTSDGVSSNALTALTNGNYVVASNWSIPGGNASVGAATWGSGTTGITGTVSLLNSLIGSTAQDSVAGGSITALTNGNYVVGSVAWDASDGIANVGAATWGNGTTGITGTVSARNSLIGSATTDFVSAGVTALTNGNYVVGSRLWDIPGGPVDVGAATWGSGTTGITGTVSLLNSLVGSTANDLVSFPGVPVALANGNYVVRSSGWSVTGAAGVGAATWGNGTTGITGTVSLLNSLMGSTITDNVTGTNVIGSADGSFFLVLSALWDNGALSNAGAITWGSGTTGRDLYGHFGTVSTQNSLVGGVASARLGTTTFDTVNSSFVGAFTADTSGSMNGRVRVGIYDPNEMTFERAQGQDMSILPAFLTTFLNAGTDVEIQANNDITISAAITVANGSGDGGDLTLTAGRSIAINANITTDNGAFTATANDPGGVSAERDAGDADITIGAGAAISTGTGNLTLQIQGSTDAGSIALGVGSSLAATTGDILLISAVDITASGAATIQTTAGGDITLVVDDAFPTSPGIGPGLFDIPNVTISSSGIVRLYAGALGISTFPASINGTAYTPGSGANELGPIYYPSGSGGSPFIVFYKEAAGPPPSPPSPTPSGGPTDEQKNRGEFKYFSAMSEAFTRWTPYSYGGIEGTRIYAPMGTGYMYFWMPPFSKLFLQDSLLASKSKKIKPPSLFHNRRRTSRHRFLRK